jgi:hypothetical protein
MRAAFGVLKRDAVFFARSSAIAIAGSGGEEAAEDAVLGVKHRQVLVGDGLDPLAAHLARQVGHLRGVQIVSGSEMLKTEREEFPGGEIFLIDMLDVIDA